MTVSLSKSHEILESREELTFKELLKPQALGVYYIFLSIFIFKSSFMIMNVQLESGEDKFENEKLVIKNNWKNCSTQVCTVYTLSKTRWIHNHTKSMY